ncbi:MAG: SIS domain-containing protein [Pasteurellaceae bacterium]|nr:SIS domain-containing protein [Pasteurellaceae bacterium]
MLNKINDIYNDTIQIQISASQLLAHKIAQATEQFVNCLLRGNKIIVCGQGRSYANAQFLVANLLNRYEVTRPSFPAVLLSLDNAVGAALISDEQYHCLYQRQFNAIAQSGDILVVISPSGNENAILDVVHCAFNKELQVLALTGENNDHIKGLLKEEDLEIRVPTNKESRVFEQHLFIINAICELIDYSLFSAQ